MGSRVKICVGSGKGLIAKLEDFFLNKILLLLLISAIQFMHTHIHCPHDCFVFPSFYFVYFGRLKLVVLRQVCVPTSLNPGVVPAVPSVLTPTRKTRGKSK